MLALNDPNSQAEALKSARNVRAGRKPVWPRHWNKPHVLSAS
jgi:hypothetical protein